MPVPEKIPKNEIEKGIGETAVSDDSKIAETGYFYLSQQLNFLTQQMTRLDNNLSQQITRLDNKIDKLDEKIENKIKHLEEKVENKINHLDEKIDGLGREISTLRLWAIGTIISILVASVSWWVAMLAK